jgi:hypothetical protein
VEADSDGGNKLQQHLQSVVRDKETAATILGGVMAAGAYRQKRRMMLSGPPFVM